MIKKTFLTLSLSPVILLLFIAFGCTGGTGKNISTVFGDSLFLAEVPSQPEEADWKFIRDLKSPVWTKHPWVHSEPEPDQVDLSDGVIIEENFPDPGGRLATAFDDLRSFLDAGNVSWKRGSYNLGTVKDTTLRGESFRLVVDRSGCRISAGNVDGIRRGIFAIEDEMLSHRGPFLTKRETEKHPVIQRRISRCFFGPIKRFPKMRDELMDTVDYYPDQYLNRLAHEGINGLWLTVEFRDLVSTRFTPDAGKDGDKRLSKLRQTVQKCLRYGIRTYIFCIEPRAWDPGSPVLEHYPELGGAPAGRGHFFCPMSKTAHDYLYESVNKIFKAVPELGGMINITHGERGTTCLSAVPSTSDYKGRIDCPRCSGKEPWQILEASLSAMEEGMHDAAPGAELISWLYMPQPQRFLSGDDYSLGEWVYDIPAHTPEGVILQFNFESGVSRSEFGKLLVGGDYWISNPGPSSRFSRIAEVAAKYGTKMSAKIQTGNSHEVASVPFVPVPSLLYRKFREMRDLGVSHTMLCWYFGNYPGLMNKAAGMLSTEPFPADEDAFLKQLASMDWKKEDVPKVVEAWKLFSEGYQNYPLVNLFQYYGPVHDGPVWPLLLRPADAPLSPTWQIGSSTTMKPWPPSGDRIGECTGDVLTLDEVVELTRRMSTSWDKGMAVLSGLQHHYVNEPDRLLDIGVAKALGIHIRSAYDILDFYMLREKMFRMEGKERLNILNNLTGILNEEIKLDKELLALSENDSRLGFHSEAEGYKYFPEKIRWRIRQLKNVLKTDVPLIKRKIMNDELLFPEYTGKKPGGSVAGCVLSLSEIVSDSGLVLPSDLKWYPLNYGSANSSLLWSSAYAGNSLSIIVTDKFPAVYERKASAVRSLEIIIEPRRLYPSKHFVFSIGSVYSDPVHITGYPLLFNGTAAEVKDEGKSYFIAHIPFGIIGLDKKQPDPIRLNVVARFNRRGSVSWRPENPLTPRLILGSDNPADIGWMKFED
jgi:hypothetical protein